MSKGSRYPHVEYYLRKFNSIDDRVLEIGCGAARYRDFFPVGRYVGADVPNPHYQDWDSVDLYARGENLPFKDGSFDLIFSQAAIDYVEGLHEMLEETRRLLKPSGKMLVFTYDKNTLRRIHQGAGEPQLAAHQHFHVYDEREMLGYLQDVGYKARLLPHVLRPHLPLMSWLSRQPLLRDFFQKRVAWRSFLAWT